MSWKLKEDMQTIYTVNLPDIGEGVVEGEVIEWLKKTGDSLRQDEPVVVVMTDKATVELPAPHPGILAKQYFQPGQIAIKGKPLYDIELTTPIQMDAKPEKKVQPTSSPPEKISVPQPIPPEKPFGEKRGIAAPPVRKLAKELGVDLNRISGTGKEGRITPQDLQQFAKPRTCRTSILHLSDDEELPVVGIRHLMAERMAESHASIPMFSYFEQTEATRLVQLRNSFKEKALKENIHITYMPFFIRALSLTIKKFPQLNSSFDATCHKLYMHKHHNVGIAIASPYGLIVPVLKNVQEMSLYELIRAYEQLKNKALENKLTSHDMKEATITISNYGVLGGGGLWATPIVNYPETTILAVARIQKQPVIKDEAIVIRDTLNLSWSFDHRVIDGEIAASCSHYYSTFIHNPSRML